MLETDYRQYVLSVIKITFLLRVCIFSTVLRFVVYVPCDRNAPAGECPTGMLDVPVPGDELGSNEAGLGTCSDGLDGEPARRLDPGEGCGPNIDGDGLIVEGNDGGDAILKDVAGLDEYA